MPPRTGAQRAGDLGKGLAAIVTLVAIVAGVPMGLYRFAGQWMPKTVPTLDQAREALSRPVSDDAMLTGLTLVGWVLWALFTLAVTVEILSWIGQAASPSTRRQSVTPGRAHGKRVRLAVPGLQNAAASLVMAALLVLPTAGAASASSSPASPAPMALQMPDQVAAPPTSPGPAPAAAPAAPQASERVTVKRGDSPWGIAERHLGEGERWRELRHEDGRALASREIIHPGQVLLVPAAPAPADTPVAVAAASAETADPATTVVRPGDSLWEIAEDKLGDGEQYQGIWTANRGRVMDDGARFRDPDVIHPGWKLSVPGQRYTPPASATTPPPSAPPAATPATPPPAPAAAASQPAAQDTDSADAAPDVGVPADSAAENTAAAPPTTIWPPPTTTAAPPTTAAAPPSTSQSPATAGPATSPPDTAPPPPAAEPQPPAAGTKESSGRLAPLPVGLVSGGLAAAAVVGLISRRRHRQIGLRRPGRRPPLPTGEAAQAETALRVGADADGAVLVDEALAAVAVAVDVEGAGLPEILGAHLTCDRVELLLASPFDDVAEPFEASADGLRWSATSADVVGFVAPVDHPSSPAPTMVTLGETEDGTLMVNLERIGLLALEGNPDRAAGVLRRVAFELGARYLNGIVHVVLVGLPEVSGLEDHVETASGLGEALDRASALRGWSDEQLTAYQVGSADVARAAGLNADTWAPSVVLAAGPFTDEELQRAAELTADPDRTGIAVVLASDRTAARWALDLDDDLVDVGPLGLAIDPHDDPGETATASVVGYAPEEAAAVSSVLETAARTDDVSTGEPPYDALDEWGWPAPAGDEQDDPAGNDKVRAEEGDELVGLHVVPDTKDPEPTFDVWIKILGPIEVEGNISGGKPRSKSKELVAALALHRDGLTTAQIESILWPAPQSGPARSTLHSTVSAARAWLRRVEGENLIPNTAVNGGESRYRLSPCVGPNWDRFQWLTRNATGVDAAERLTEALAMVRGEPLGAGGWPWALPHVTEMRCAIADAAHRLAQLRLETKDLPRARAAARAGLRGSPWDQLLYGDLMEASSKGGDPEGVDEARRELVARLGGEDHEIRPDVEAIYQRCRKQHAT